MARVNNDGTRYQVGTAGLRLTADVEDGLLGYVMMDDVLNATITDVGSVLESYLNSILVSGIYKYRLSDSSDETQGYLIQIRDVQTRVYYQYRLEKGTIKTRTKTLASGNWSDWQEIGGVDPNRIAFNSDGTEFAATDLNKPRTEGRMSLGSNGDVGVSVGNNGELGIGVNRNSKYYPVMEVKKDNKTRFTPVGSPYVMAQMEKGRIIFSSDQVANSEVGAHLDLNDKVATLKAEDKINLESANETTIKSSGLYVSGIGGYDGTNPGTAKTLQEVVNESGGITDLGVVSGWNDVVDTGIYKYTLTTENGISGLLFVTSAPKRDGSGKDHYQVRMEAGKIYSRTGESLNIVSGRYTWQDWEEVGGGSSVSVVQSTGQSTTEVMSQKAVTDELGKKATETEVNQLNEGIMKDEGLYEDVDTLGETFSRTSTNGEQVSYINHRIEEYAVGADAPDIFTYDEQVHTLKLTQFTVHPQEGDLSFIEKNYRGVLIDPTWSYVNFICSNEPRYFSARIGGGKCVLVDTNGKTSGDHYIQLFAEAAYSASTGNIEVSIFAEYKLSGQGAENNPLYINGNLPGYLRIWIV